VVHEQTAPASVRLRVTTGGDTLHSRPHCAVNGGMTSVGILDSMDADTLRLRLRNSTTAALPQAQITSIEQSRGRSRLRGTIIGWMLGALPGEVAFFIAFTTTDKSLNGLTQAERTRRQNRNFNAIMTTWFGGGIGGALLGAALSRETWANVRLVPGMQGNLRFAEAPCDG
jgi:hypothetical protein